MPPSKKRSSSRTLKAPARKPAAPRSSRNIPVLRAIPKDTVLAPQAEAPRQQRGTDRSRGHARVKELSWTEFDRHVQKLATSLRGKVQLDAVVGLAHGGVFVGGALAAALKVEFFPVRVSRRARDLGTAGIRVHGAMPRELRGRRVLVVDDVAASGEAIRQALALLVKVGASTVHTATLLQRDLGYVPDHAAIRSDDFHVFPWDYDTRGLTGSADADPDTAGA